MTNQKLPSPDEAFHEFIARIHPKPIDEMTDVEYWNWYYECIEWVGYFGFRDAAKEVGR